MIYSEKKGVGIDELLSFVDKTIKLNLEREKKHELLRLKVEELKKLFKDNSLAKLSRLKFTFSEEDILPSLGEFDLNIEEQKEIEKIEQTEPTQESVIYTSEMIDSMYSEEETGTQKPPHYVDENGNPIQYTEEELEMMEEEARAERNLKMFKNKKNGMASKIELPPR
jgi:hypothetical protein